MMKRHREPAILRAWPTLAWLMALVAVYGRLILFPSLHPVFPENDIWNLPIRWSVAEPLGRGLIPLWNPLTAFGTPWLAQFQTGVFYPGTWIFAGFGLKAWNLYSLAHLLLYAAGLHLFLRSTGVSRTWAGTISTISLVTLCAFHHIGSNAPADTMAWIPWVFLGLRRMRDGSRGARTLLGCVTALQVLAGYPQIVMFTWICALPYALFVGGRTLLGRLVPPLGAALLATCAQWLPGVEYFLLHAVRRSSIPDNPHHVLPLENLKTLFDPHALAGVGLPDYLRSPSFFYHNLYVGLIPLLLVAAGWVLFRRIRRETRLHLVLMLLSALGSFGVVVTLFHGLRIPYPDILEASKMWVLIVFFLLTASASVLQDLFPKPGAWKWVLLVLAVLDPARAALFHPLERNLTPLDPEIQEARQFVLRQMNGGRLLSLADPGEYRRLALSGEWHRDHPVFKHFIPNTNLLDGIAVANGNGSTWPGNGSFNALMYFQNAYPYDRGNLLDLLGVDVIHLPEKVMPPHFRKVGELDGWGVFRNPGSVGARFFFTGTPVRGSRKEAFEAFADGRASPLKNLFLEPTPVSAAPLRSGPTDPPDREYRVPDLTKPGYLVRTENALPGWRAWVDGKPQPILLADGIFQAVAYPAGTDSIAFRYEPTSFRFGLFVNLLALGVGWAFCWFHFIPSKRRPPRHPSTAC